MKFNSFDVWPEFLGIVGHFPSWAVGSLGVLSFALLFMSLWRG